MATVLTALILAVVGLALGGGGIRLAMLGGSWYYVITGLAFLITAWLLFRRKSLTGGVEAVPRAGSWGGLNEALHAAQ